jgi:glutaminyl-tRNA synthetase
MSKRFLLALVKEARVSGGTTRAPATICGLRRRGYTSASIRRFCDDIGVTTQESTIDVGRLENAVRDDLNKTAPCGHARAAAPQGRHRELARGQGR